MMYHLPHILYGVILGDFILKVTSRLYGGRAKKSGYVVMAAPAAGTSNDLPDGWYIVGQTDDKNKANRAIDSLDSSYCWCGGWWDLHEPKDYESYINGEFNYLPNDVPPEVEMEFLVAQELLR